jgi:hypothetical protein
MESQQPARFHRHVLFGLVMLALALPANALAPPEVRVVLNSDRYVVGSRWTLDILIDAPDPLTVRVPVPTLPPALSLADGPYIRETSWERVPGTLSRATKVSLTLRTLAPGIVEVGPFEVKVGSLLQTVPAVTVYLLAADEAKRRFPVELRWVKPEGPFFEGQAIPLMLQARNLDVLAQPQDPGLGAPAGSLWEKAVGLGEIEINSIGEDRLMNVPWGGWMLIPTKPGTLTVPAFKGSVSGLDRVVPSLVLDVQPLPPEAAAWRAVGDFSYTVEAKEGEAAQGGQLVVTQELSGRGNFPYLKMPEVSVPELTLTSRQEGTRYRAAKGGYEGSLLVTWRFSSDQARTVAVTLPGFAAFQPKTGRVDTWDPRAVSVALHFPTASPAKPVEVAQPLTWAGVLATRPWGVTHGWAAFLLFLPGPLFLLGTFLFRGHNRGLLVLLTLGLVLVSAGDSPPEGFAEAAAAQGSDAADRWGALTKAHPEEPGLWYNKALACRDAGRTAEAVHAFRMALRTGFQGDRAARGLLSLEEKELLTDQFLPWTGWPTNLLFLALCIVLNLAFVFWGAQRLSGSSAWLPPLAVAILVAAALGVFVVGAETARHEPDAVVGLADGPIRKVPGDLAETWMTLKAGTVVKVQGASERWVLVQTGYGLEGWVEASGLLSLSGVP